MCKILPSGSVVDDIDTFMLQVSRFCCESMRAVGVAVLPVSFREVIIFSNSS
jgi:hypothetical protein